MPQFPIDLKPEGDETDDKGEEAKAIAAYFAAASNRESGELKRLVDPIRKYHQAEVETDMLDARDAAKTQPSSRPAGVPPASGGFAVAEAHPAAAPRIGYDPAGQRGDQGRGPAGAGAGCRAGGRAGSASPGSSRPRVLEAVIGRWRRGK